jgi:hypothetical protein
MYLTQRTRQNVRIASIAVAIYVVLVVLLSLGFPGSATFGGSFVRWFLGIPVGLAVYGVLEWGGDKLVSLPLWAKMPSAVRILLLALLGALFWFAIVASLSWWYA